MATAAAWWWSEREWTASSASKFRARSRDWRNFPSYQKESITYQVLLSQRNWFRDLIPRVISKPPEVTSNVRGEEEREIREMRRTNNNHFDDDDDDDDANATQNAEKQSKSNWSNRDAPGREPPASQPVSVTMVKITYQENTGIPDSAFSFFNWRNFAQKWIQ